MTRTRRASLLAALLGSLIALPALAQTARTTTGTVRGTTEGGVAVYRGIPYAAPPVSQLRWSPPRPAAPWRGVRDATRFSPVCPQLPFGTSPLPGPLSEDCLYLNVWTAAGKAGAGRPVMVFIHGGGFIGGSGSDPLYDGARLARKGVVVVSFNYRLGTLGFLAHPELSAASPRHVSGNYGMLDQVAALHWVKANIAAFGGDPARVTIFGESAGGTAVATLMASPLAKGLFARAIAESPAIGFRNVRLTEAEAMGAKLGSLAQLRALPFDRLLAYNARLSPNVPGTETEGFPMPLQDGWFLPWQVSERLASPVPLIVGTNADEGSMFAADDRAEGAKARFDARLAGLFGPLATRAAALYSPADDADTRTKDGELIADSLFNAGTRHIARQVTAAGRPAWRYLFSLDVGGRAPMHSDELRYVFGTLHLPGYTGLPAATEADRTVSSQIMDAWVRFATTGSPAGPGLPAWPQVDARGEPLLAFSRETRLRKSYRDVQLDLIDAWFHCTAAGQCAVAASTGAEH